MPDKEFKLEVTTIYPREDGVGQVRFEINDRWIEKRIELLVMSFGDEGIDAGVKEAARHLADFAERLAKSAKEMAE